MTSFVHFLSEEKYSYLFHGTSSKFRADIMSDGLKKSGKTHKNSTQDGIYLTTDWGMAVREAEFTCDGEGDESGVGGSAEIVIIDRNKVKGLRRDGEYHGPGHIKSYLAFWTPNDVSVQAIIAVVDPDGLEADKYKTGNAQLGLKQVGVLDKNGNPIQTLDKVSPRLINGMLRVYQGSDSSKPNKFDLWTTNLHSDSIEGMEHIHSLLVNPNQVSVSDATHQEIWLEL